MTTFFEKVCQTFDESRDCIKEIDKILASINVNDVNSNQCILLYNMRDREMTVGQISRELSSNKNMTYNLRKLDERGYLVRKDNSLDKRGTVQILSKKGKDLASKLDKFFKEPHSS